MKIKVFLQARTFSNRLPFKSLCSINGLPIVLLCAKRLSNKGADVIVVTSDKSQDDELVNILKTHNIKVFRGSLNNVYERFIKATKKLKDKDVIVRATADNLFNDGHLINLMYREFKKQNLNYLSLSRKHNAPKGIGLELIKLKTLRSLNKNEISSTDKEHVTFSIRKNFEIKNYIEFKDFKFQKKISKIRVTIDKLEDFILIKKFIEDQKNFVNLKSKNLIKKFIRQKPKYDVFLKKRIKEKKLLILGASHDQLKTIKIARQMGLYTIAFDKNFYAPGKDLVDQFIFLSNRNVDQLKYFTSSIKIDGVITQGSDLPHISSAIENQIGVKNIPLRSAYICTDKYLMKKFFKKNLIPIPKFFLQAKNKKLKRIVKFPIVLKPLDKSGSRGVFLCKNARNFNTIKKKTFVETSQNNILVEEYLKGPQISTESLIYNSKVYTAGYVDRNYEMLETTKPAIIENGGTYPSNYFRFYNTINKYINILAKKLNIKNGVIKGDIVINKDKVYFIEIALRLSGGDFSESVIPLSSSFNIIQNTINLALNKKIKQKDLRMNFNKTYFANRYFFAKKGHLSNIIGINKIKKKTWIKKILIFNKLGDKLAKTSNHSNRLGVFVLSAPTIETLNKRIKYVYDNIKFKITDI